MKISLIFFLRMAMQHIAWSLGLGIILSQGMIQSSPVGVTSKPTVLSTMRTDLTSVFGTCSFPPKDVLSDVYNFDFLEPCDRKIPPANVTTSDESLIRCLGLLEVGLRLCSMDQKYFDNDGSLSHIPIDSHGFADLMGELSKKNDSSLCSDLTNVQGRSLGLPDKNDLGVDLPQINGWNLKNVFQETKGSCTRICFDIKNNGHLLCKLILWGSNLLSLQQKLPESSIGTQSTHMAHNSIGSQSSLVNGKVASLPTTNLDKTHIPESSLVDLDLPIEPKAPELESKVVDQQSKQVSTNYNSQPSSVEYVDAGNTHNSESDMQQILKNFDTGTGTMQDSRPMTSSVNEDISNPVPKVVLNSQGGQDHEPDEIKPNDANLNPVSSTQDLTAKTAQTGKIADNGQAAPLPGSEIRTEDSNRPKDNIGLNQNSTRLTQAITSKQEQMPTLLGSEEENVKNIDNNAKSKPTHNEQEPTSSQDQTSKTGPRPITPVAAKPDANVEDNLPPSPVEKTIPDLGPGGDEFHDQYDSSLDQNQEGDDGMNFQEDQEPPEISHKPTSYNNNNYKYPREEFPNDNTFTRDRYEDEDSHFFTYFMTMIVLCIIGYVVFHNKQKILALALEGRSKRSSRRRPVTANYHKLDNNLEEAVSSPCSTSVTHVIY